MPIPFGKLRDPVDILDPKTIRDDAGGETKTYRAGNSVFVWIKPLRGNEFLQAKQVVGDVTHKIIGHYDELKDVTPENRIRNTETDVEYDVQVVLPGDDRQSVDIFAVQRFNE